MSNKEQPLIRETLLGDAIQGMCKALRDEIRTARTDPGRSFEVSDGARVFSADDGYLYTFKSDIALPIPPETPVSLALDDGEVVQGTLISLQDFDVLLHLRADVGETIPRAKVASEPWFILESLRERLEESQELPVESAALSMALLQLEDTETGADQQAVKDTEAVLRRVGFKALIPNEGQSRAIASAIGSRLHFIWGPPGTGKTANLAQVVRGLVQKGGRVLVMAHANVAVDVAILRVADAFNGSQELGQGKILRLGVPLLPEARSRQEILPEAALERTEPDLIQRKRELEARREKLAKRLKTTRGSKERTTLGQALKDVRQELALVNEQLRIAFARLVSEAKVLAATLSRFVIDENLQKWGPDTVVIDEASMAPFPAVLMASLRAVHRMLLFGDFRQLPPILLSGSNDARFWLGRDAFEVSGVSESVYENDLNPKLSMLDTQYRMAEPICRTVSDLAYDGRLVTGEQVAEATRLLADIEPAPGAAVVVVDTSSLSSACFREPRPGSYSRVNPLHALLAISLAAGASKIDQRKVAVITPYRAQARIIAALSRSLGSQSAITSATVHRFQGSERDMVIFDLVDAFPESRASRLTGTDQDTALRLINVALSRARGKLIVLLDQEFIRDRHPARSPARHALELLFENGTCVAADSASVGGDNEDLPIRWHSGWDEAQGLVSERVRDAEESVVLNLPPAFEVSNHLVRQVAGAAPDLERVTIFANPTTAQHFEDTSADLRLMNRPGGFFALIDSHWACLGGLSEQGAFASLDDVHVVETFASLYLGETLAAPAPSAEAEEALSEIYGRCVECGSGRRPRRDRESGWVIRCSTRSHAADALTVKQLGAIVDALEVRCPECGGIAIARSGKFGLFLGCPNYRKGCGGRPPRLDNLFGGK